MCVTNYLLEQGVGSWELTPWLDVAEGIGIDETENKTIQ